jgi:hypothetical protein
MAALSRLETVHCFLFDLTHTLTGEIEIFTNLLESALWAT